MPMDSHHFSPFIEMAIWCNGASPQAPAFANDSHDMLVLSESRIPHSIQRVFRMFLSKRLFVRWVSPYREFLMNHQLPTQIAMFRRQIHPFQSHCPAKLILPAPSSATPAPFGLRTLRKDPYQHLTSKVDCQGDPRHLSKIHLR